MEERAIQLPRQRVEDDREYWLWRRMHECSEAVWATRFAVDGVDGAASTRALLLDTDWRASPWRLMRNSSWPPYSAHIVKAAVSDAGCLCWQLGNATEMPCSIQHPIQSLAMSCRTHTVQDRLVMQDLHLPPSPTLANGWAQPLQKPTLAISEGYCKTETRTLCTS